MRTLMAAKDGGQLSLYEVALYGTQIHAVVSDVESSSQAIRALLESQGIMVKGIEWIAPTLEDVFISAVTSRKD